MITKIKRQLAKWGIGNPLNQLFYSSREIAHLKEEKKLLNPNEVRHLYKRKRFVKSPKKYLVGYDISALYSLDDNEPHYTEVHFVRLMTENEMKDGLRNGKLPRKPKIFSVELQEVFF